MRGGPIVLVGAVPLALIGASTGRIGGIAMGRTFVPPRSDTAHPPQRPYRSSCRWGLCRSGWVGCAAAGYGAVSATGLIRARGAPWARLWPCRVAATPRWLGVAAFARRRYPSTACHNPRRLYSGRLGTTLGHGTGAVRSADNGGRSAPPHAGGARARSGRYYHPGVRLSESRSCVYATIPSTVATHEPKSYIDEDLIDVLT